MIYTSYYNSPIGKILLASKSNKLIGSWIEGQKYYLENLKEDFQINNNDITLIQTKKWLDKYFNSENPNISELQIAPIGSNFRQTVWKALCKIPYGQTTTYGELAKLIAKTLGKEKMSAQAVGQAISHNPILIIIPCHRVIGINGTLTGYAGGIENKIKLLKLENIDITKLKI